MLRWLSDLFSSASFIPQGHSLLWQPGLLVAMVLSNLALAFAAAVGALLLLRARTGEGRGAPRLLAAIALLLAALACLLDVLVIWNPAYRLQVMVRALAALAAVGAGAAGLRRRAGR